MTLKLCIRRNRAPMLHLVIIKLPVGLLWGPPPSALTVIQVPCRPHLQITSNLACHCTAQNMKLNCSTCDGLRWYFGLLQAFMQHKVSALCCSMHSTLGLVISCKHSKGALTILQKLKVCSSCGSTPLPTPSSCSVSKQKMLAESSQGVLLMFLRHPTGPNCTSSPSFNV